ncbi:hypothetical protein GB937_010171 [Aspergillus fischeri]|nr:hypothetical protein GB937_010171 [Aspergillus fischeri]
MSTHTLLFMVDEQRSKQQQKLVMSRLWRDCWQQKPMSMLPLVVKEQHSKQPQQKVMFRSWTKADVNASPAGGDGRTALEAAAAKGHVQVVGLLAAKADVNAPTGGGGQTALQVAAGQGHIQVVERLRQAGAQ